MTLTDPDPRHGAGSAPRPASPGRAAALGRIDISDSVVAKIAGRAALEHPDAGAAATTLLGVTLPGAGLLGTKTTDLHELPKTSATVDGSVATVELTLSVRWPKSVAQVTGAVRDHVRGRLTELTGLDVTEVRISVTDLATTFAAPPRVR